MDSDHDGDGALQVTCGGDDCDDNDPRRFPGNPETCDGIDNDCDSVVDGEAATAACPEVAGGEVQCSQAKCSLRCVDANTLPNADMTACVPIARCSGVTTCEPGTCLEGESDYSCDCPESFAGDGTKACTCPLGSRLADDGKSCRPPAWSEPVPLQEGIAPPQSMALVRADDGSGALAWAEGGFLMLKGMSYLPATGWASTVHEVAGVEPGLLVAEALPGGGAVCMTVKGTSSSNPPAGHMPKLFSAILRPGGFEDAKQHDKDIWYDGSYSHRVAGNGAGHVVATWYTYDTFDIRAHSFVDEYIEGMGWLGLRELREGPGAPEAAVDDLGRVVLAYQDTFAVKQAGAWSVFGPSDAIGLPITLNNTGSGVGGVTSLSRFSFDDGWSEPEATGVNDTALTRIDDMNRILTVWVEGNEIRYRYFSDGAWSDADVVYADTQPPTSLRLSMNDRGDALIAWATTQGFPMLRAQYFVAGLGWQFVQVVHQGTGPRAKPLWMDVKLGDQGDALMVWLEQGQDEMVGPRAFRSAVFR